MTFLSSTSPTRNANAVVIRIAIISVIGKNAYKTVPEIKIPAIRDGPPGLATIAPPFL